MAERREHPRRAPGDGRAPIRLHARDGAGRSPRSTCRTAPRSTTTWAGGFFSWMRSLATVAGRVPAAAADGGRGGRRVACGPHSCLHVSCGAAPAASGGGSGAGWLWWDGMRGFGAAGPGGCPGRPPRPFWPRAVVAAGAGTAPCARMPVHRVFVTLCIRVRGGALHMVVITIICRC